MAKREVKDKKLIALHPGQQRHRALAFLATKLCIRHQWQSFNAIYVNSSLACLKKGRTKTMSTYGSNLARPLESAGLLDGKTQYPERDLNAQSVYEQYRSRFQVRHNYKITALGLKLLDSLNKGKTVRFQNGVIIVENA